MTLTINAPTWLIVIVVASFFVSSLLGLASSILQIQVKKLERAIAERESHE